MPRGRKRPARSRQRVEPDTSCRESVRPSKKRRPPPPSRQTAEHRRRSVRESPSTRSSSSDWSSSRERRESKRRREIAERARARPSTTETPRRKTEAGKSKKKRRDSKKPSGTTEPSGETPENEAPVLLPEKSSTTDLPSAKSADPERSDEPGPSSEPPDEDPSVPTVPCCIPRCPWRGPDNALPDHVEGEHAGMVLSGPIQQLQVPVSDPERGAALSRVVRAFGELFAVHFRRPPKGTTVLGCVQLLGPPERASDFIYQMEVRDENGDENGEMVDPLLQHSPLVANMSSSQEFEIAETLKEVCTAEQINADLDKEPTWGNRETITIEVEISTTTDYYDPDEEATRTSPPPELTFMWM